MTSSPQTPVLDTKDDNNFFVRYTVASLYVSFNHNGKKYELYRRYQTYNKATSSLDHYLFAQIADKKLLYSLKRLSDSKIMLDVEYMNDDAVMMRKSFCFNRDDWCVIL